MEKIIGRIILVLFLLGFASLIVLPVFSVFANDYSPYRYKFYVIGKFERTENYSRSKYCDKVDVVTTSNVMRNQCYDEWMDVNPGSNVEIYVKSNKFSKAWGYKNSNRMIPESFCWWYTFWCMDDY